jgi:hypothetical protein
MPLPLAKIRKLSPHFITHDIASLREAIFIPINFNGQTDLNQTMNFC